MLLQIASGKATGVARLERCSIDEATPWRDNARVKSFVADRYGMYRATGLRSFHEATVELFGLAK